MFQNPLPRRNGELENDEIYPGDGPVEIDNYQNDDVITNNAVSNLLSIREKMQMDKNMRRTTQTQKQQYKAVVSKVGRNMKVINRVLKKQQAEAHQDQNGLNSLRGSRSQLNQSPMGRQNASPVRTYKMNYTSPYKISQKSPKRQQTDELNLTVDLPTTQKIVQNEESPDLIEAREEMNHVTKAGITEIKSLAAPPQLVKIVLETVQIMFGVEPGWANARKMLASPSFLLCMANYDIYNMSFSVFKKLQKYVN